MLDYLTRTDGSPVLYILKAAATAIAGTFLIVIVAAIWVSDPEPSDSETSRGAMLFTLLIGFPLFATLLLHPVLLLARRMAPTYWHAAAGTAALFALAFGLAGGPVTGIVFAWPFFIYSVTFLAWQLKSVAHAWIMTVLVQVAVNLLPALLTK